MIIKIKSLGTRVVYVNKTIFKTQIHPIYNVAALKNHLKTLDIITFEQNVS